MKHRASNQESSQNQRSIGRLLTVAMPVVALAALTLAAGCGSDDAEPVPDNVLPIQGQVEANNPASNNPANNPADGNPGEMANTPAAQLPADNAQNPANGEGVDDQLDLNNSTADQGGGDTTPAEEPAVEEPVVDAPLEDAFVEDNGLNCDILPIPASNQLQPETTLPDPFLGLNGERIATRAEWRCRRQEIRRLAEGFIYGEKPERPESVTGNVTNNSISVNVQHNGQTVNFTASITMPPGATGPVPAIIGYGGSGFQGTILDEGVAFINYNVGNVGDEETRFPKEGAFYSAYPEHQDTGMLVAWAWGVSRMIDVLADSGAQLIDAESIGVHGCSRSGKGAFIAGAFDQRVKLTIPFESGMSGVPAFRMIVPEGGEVLRNTIEYRPWAGDTYEQFLVLGAGGDNPALQTQQNNQSGELQFLLPLDTHEVIGMVAPRGLLVLGNPTIANLAPRAEHITVLAGAEIYSALGAEQNISYISNTNNGTHCAFRQEYVPQMQQNIRKFLKNDANATTGAIEPAGNFTGQQLGANINWQTPTLQ